MVVQASTIIPGDIVYSRFGDEFTVTLVVHGVDKQLFDGDMSICGTSAGRFFIEHLDSDDVVYRAN